MPTARQMTVRRPVALPRATANVNAPEQSGPVVPGLRFWTDAQPHPRGNLRSPQLDRAGGPIGSLVGFSASMHAAVPRGHASLRETAPAKGRVLYNPTIRPALRGQEEKRTDAIVWGRWGDVTHKIAQQRWVDVPLWAVVGPPRFSAGRNRDAFRRPQAGVKVLSLAQALRNSVAAIAKARGY